jgi:hypothetical protein
MVNFVFENARGEQLDLWNNDLFFLVNQNGQTHASADISALTIGDIDGDLVTNVRAQPRTITLTLRINPAVNVEMAKRAILRIVKLKQIGKIVWTQDDRTMQIIGIVESIDMPRWNKAVAMQISLHCSNPFWEDANESIQMIDDSIPLHYFTAHDDMSSDMLFFVDAGIVLSEYDATRSRSFYNAGDVAVGMHIEIMAFDTVTNPIIYDAEGNFFGVGYGTKQVVMQAGDVIDISTVRGNLLVTKNKTTNLLNYVVPRSTWLQLQTGQNDFRIDSADSVTDNMTFTLTYVQQYI